MRSPLVARPSQGRDRGPKRRALHLITIVAFAAGVAAQTDTRPSFSEWLAGVRTEALSRGIRQEIVDEALSNIEEPLPVVIERDRTQAERILPLETYVARRLKPKFIRTARERFEKHRALLTEVGEAYGVSPRIIVEIGRAHV